MNNDLTNECKFLKNIFKCYNKRVKFKLVKSVKKLEDIHGYIMTIANVNQHKRGTQGDEEEPIYL